MIAEGVLRWPSGQFQILPVFLPVRSPRCLLAVALACSLAFGVVGACGADLDEGWREAAQLFSREANRTFQTLARERTGVEQREAKLGEAVTLLQVPPLTAARVADSVARLRALVAENANDETGLAARYFLGRVRQIFETDDTRPEDPEEFAGLIRDHPESAFAQLAMVKLTLRRLYAPAQGPKQRLEQAAQLERRITLPRLACDYHLAMGNALIFFRGSDREALRHLVAARDLGLPDDLARADVLVQIGELARGLGERAVARESYARFLREVRHDVRILMIRDRLAELEKGGKNE